MLHKRKRRSEGLYSLPKKFNRRPVTPTDPGKAECLLPGLKLFNHNGLWPTHWPKCDATGLLGKLGSDGRLAALGPLDAIEPELVDCQQIEVAVVPQSLGKAVIGQGGGQVPQQLGTGGVADAG